MQSKENKTDNIPLSPMQQIAFRDSNARINILEGAVRSGKSFTLLLRFLKELRKGPEGDYVIVGKNRDTVYRNIIHPLQDLLTCNVQFKRSYGEFTLFGRKIYCVGAADERAEQKIRGSSLAGALVDEATIIPSTFFRMLLSRLSIKGAKLFASTNPDSPYHWLKTDFIDRSNDLDLKIFKFKIDDNPSLDPKYIEDLKKEYQGLWYRRYIEGEWVLAEGAVYDFFDKNYHVAKKAPTYAKQYYLGIDYGTSNAFAAVLVGYNDAHHPSLWIEKEYYWDSKKQGYQKTDGEYIMDLEREFDGYPIQLIYLDPSAASFEVELRRNKKRVKQADNSILDGVRFVGSLFTLGDLVICDNCTNLLQEMESYVWDEKAVKRGEDKPLKQRDHAIDAMRYVLYSHFGKRNMLKNFNDVKSYETYKMQQRQDPSMMPNVNTGWQQLPPFSGGRGFR